MRTPEAAKRLGVSVWTVRKLASEGKLAHTRGNGEERPLFYFKSKDIEAFKRGKHADPEPDYTPKFGPAPTSNGTVKVIRLKPEAPQEPQSIVSLLKNIDQKLNLLLKIWS